MKKTRKIIVAWVKQINNFLCTLYVNIRSGNKLNTKIGSPKWTKGVECIHYPNYANKQDIKDYLYNLLDSEQKKTLSAFVKIKDLKFDGPHDWIETKIEVIRGMKNTHLL